MLHKTHTCALQNARTHAPAHVHARERTYTFTCLTAGNINGVLNSAPRMWCSKKLSEQIRQCHDKTLICNIAWQRRDRQVSETIQAWFRRRHSWQTSWTGLFNVRATYRAFSTELHEPCAGARPRFACVRSPVLQQVVGRRLVPFAGLWPSFFLRFWSAPTCKKVK